MNILMLSLIFPPETGSARRVGELADFFAGKGHDVSVVTGFPTYPQGALYPGFRKNLIRREQLSEKLSVTRVWLYTTPKRFSTLRRLVHYGTFTVSSFFAMLTCKRPDVIYVVSHPYFLGLSAILLRLLRGGKIVLDVQDSWPEAPIALGYIRWQWLIRMLVSTEKYVYRAANLISTLSPEMASRLIFRGAEPEKVETVYNWVDHRRFSPVDGGALRSRLGLDGLFVVLYAGNIGKPQGLDVVISAAGIVQDSAKIHYVIIGDGAEKRTLQELARSHGVTNVSFLPAVPESEIIDYLGMADALLVHLTKAPHRSGVIPSKLQIYMAAGKPILLGAVGASARIVADASCGVVFEPGSPEGLAEAAQRVAATTPEERQALGMTGRAYAMQHFDLTAQCSRSEQLIAELIAPQS